MASWRVNLVVVALSSAAACRDPRPESKPVENVASSPPPVAADALEAPPAPADAVPLESIPPPADVAAPPATAARTASGVATLVVQKGTGKDAAGPDDLVTVHYTGWSASGEMFDSSVRRGAPETLPLTAAPRAWRDGIVGMVVGEKRRIWIPENLAAQGRPGQPRSAIVYEVELLAIVAPPSAPHDVAAAPADATRTASGLAYKRLANGTGTTHPTEANLVVVNFTAWKPSGELVESSVLRRRPTERPLGAMLPGWTEALKLMVQGEKLRLWVPAELAYRGDPAKPQGPMVFDLELVAIK
jgi:FKBP-type peptidyl-prolyl cis-trans isomerase